MIKKTLTSLLLGGSLAITSCNSGMENLVEDPTEVVTPTPSPTDTPTPILNLPSPENKQKGMNVVSWWHTDYDSPEAITSLENLRASNNEWMSLLVTWYQDGITSTDIYRKEFKTHSDESLVKMITEAQRLGMNVMLKPHVDLEGGNWRGNIGGFLKEEDYAKWFASYRSFINHYAELAEQNNVGQLCLGTEFVGLTNRENDWREVIRGVREKFKGKLVYSENHDNIENNKWFGELDYIGISGYFPLTKKLDPTVEELKEAWNPHIEKIERVQRKFGKEVIFTEIGYRSVDGTNIHPWAKVDCIEQADCYKAFFESVWKNSWMHGAYFWGWETRTQTGQDEGFTPQEKKAQEVIKEYYGQ